MKLKKLMLLVFALLLSVIFIACDNNADTSLKSESQNSDAGSRLAFKTLQVVGNDVYGVVSNQTSVFSFLNEIELFGNADYIVSLDISGVVSVNTKTVALEEGDNTFYVFATVEGSSNLYTVHIRRRPVYTVIFDTDGGTVIAPQFVEEGGCAMHPVATTKTGYTFIEWQHDFSQPITSDITIKAKWAGNTYTVKYDPDGDGVLNNLTVTYGSYFMLETPKKEGYTFEGWFNGERKYGNGMWLATYDVTLSPQWKINTYIVTTKTNLDCGDVSGSGFYQFGSKVTVSAETKKLGYTWLGWYDASNNRLTSATSYSFTLSTSDMELEARWKISDDIADFIFTSSQTTCTITGVYDTTKTSYIIPDYVKTIDASAFSGCSGLTSISIPNSVTSIGESAFSGCSGLTSIVIPNSVTEIGYSVFKGCSRLTSITIPNSVTSIGEDAFSGCSSLTSITIPNSVNAIAGAAFYGCSSLKSITIPNSVTSIGIYAFSGCSSLTSITIPNSVTAIAGSAFYGCSSLKSITIPNSVTSIGSSAFEGCSSLTSLHYNGTKSQWNAIPKNYNWDKNTGDYTVYCTDGNIKK